MSPRRSSISSPPARDRPPPPLPPPHPCPPAAAIPEDAAATAARRCAHGTSDPSRSPNRGSTSAPRIACRAPDPPRHHPQANTATAATNHALLPIAAPRLDAPYRIDVQGPHLYPKADAGAKLSTPSGALRRRRLRTPPGRPRPAADSVSQPGELLDSSTIKAAGARCLRRLGFDTEPKFAQATPDAEPCAATTSISRARSPEDDDDHAPHRCAHAGRPVPRAHRPDRRPQ